MCFAQTKHCQTRVLKSIQNPKVYFGYSATAYNFSTQTLAELPASTVQHFFLLFAMSIEESSKNYALASAGLHGWLFSQLNTQRAAYY